LPAAEARRPLLIERTQTIETNKAVLPDKSADMSGFVRFLRQDYIE